MAKVANATGQTKEPFSEEFAETMDRGIEEYRQDVLKILAAIETDGGTETARLTEMMNKVKVDEFKSVEGDFAEFVDASDEALHGIIY